MTRLLVQHLLYHSKGEMLRWEQTKGHSKRTRAWQKKTYKVFSLNLLYQGKCWTKIIQQIRNEQPCNLLPKSPEPYQVHSTAVYCLAQWTYP